jgi:hypothetical protein
MLNVQDGKMAATRHLVCQPLPEPQMNRAQTATVWKFAGTLETCEAKRR